jgi:hypothetical protein
MRRIGAMLSMLAVLLLLDTSAVRAAGGGNPPPFTPVIVNPAISATILVDTHRAGVTPTAGQASVSLRLGTITTQATFNVVPSYQSQWGTGCNTSLTGLRFLWAPPTAQITLLDWVPPFVLDSLFLPFGILPSVGGPVPVITQITNGNGNGECLTSPDTGVTGPGYLLMNGTIQFLVPARK